MAAREPFLFFCDFGAELGPKVAAGRRAEFARFPQFADPVRRLTIPDPEKESTFLGSLLRWDALAADQHRERRDWVRMLLDIRRREIAPRLDTSSSTASRRQRLGETALTVEWQLVDARLRLVANLGARPLAPPPPWVHEGRLLFEWPSAATKSELPPWSVVYRLVEPDPS